MIAFVFYIRTALNHIGYYTTLFKARHKLASKILSIFNGYRVGKHIELLQTLRRLRTAHEKLP